MFFCVIEMFKIESYLSPFLLNWLNSYVKLKNEDFKLSLWEGDVAFNKLDLRLEVFQDLLGIPLSIRSGRIQELRIHVPWTKLGSEPICLTVNTIEFVISLPTDDEKSSASQKNAGAESLSTEFEHNAEFIQQQQQAPPAPQRQPSYLDAMLFKILNNVQIVVNNLIVKYVEGDMIVSINVKSAESWSTDVDWNKAFVDVLPPNYGLRKIANLHDATICLDRCTPSGKIESYNEPFMYRCSLQCRMLFEYPTPYSRIPSSSKLALFFGEPEFSLADTQLPLLLRLIRACLTVAYGNGNPEKQRPVDRNLSSTTIPIVDESGVLQQYLAEPNSGEGNTWGNWAMSYLPGVVSWTTGFQPPIILPPEPGSEEAVTAGQKPPFAFVGIYAKRVTFCLKLSKKHVDPLGTSSRIQFHPCLTIVATDVKNELAWRGDSFFSCSVILSSLVGKTAGFCTCHVRDEGEQVIACGPPIPLPLPVLFDQILTNTDEIPNNADEHLAKYSDERIAEMQPAFMLDFIMDTDKTREKPDAPLEELRRFQRVIFRWFFFNPTISLTGGLFHRITKFLSHAQKSDFDLVSSVCEGAKKNPNAKVVENPFLSSQEVTSLDFNVCGRSDRIHIRNFTLFVALNNHPCALPGKHSGIFAQRLSQIGSPLRLCAGNIIVAKTEPLFSKEIGLVLKAYTGPLTEELLLPCCAQSVVECSNLSLDLPNCESGATFAVACGLSFSITAKNYSAVDTAILNSAGLAVDFMSFTMPDVSLTFNYPCLLYVSLVMTSYAAYDGGHANTVSASGPVTPTSTPSGLEVMTTALLGMIYAPSQEAFVLSTNNISFQRADFSNIHSASQVISCLSAVLSSVRLDLASGDRKVVPILSFTQPDIPSAAVFVQWESTKLSIHYILASFSSLTFNFSSHLNNILLSVDLTRYLDSRRQFTNQVFCTERQTIAGKAVTGGRLDLHQQSQGQHQSAFRLLADLLASETVSTSKPVVPVEKSRVAPIINAIHGAVVNVNIGSIHLNILDQLTLKVPHTTISTPTGFKRLFTQQLFKLAEPLEVTQEEAMLWTIRLEQIYLALASQQIFNPPLTVWATLSAIQSAEETRPSSHGSHRGDKDQPSSLPLAQHQLSLHVNVETISLCLHRANLRSLSQLQSTLVETFSVVSSQMTILPSSSSQSGNTLHEYDEATAANSQLASAVQFWLQLTVPRLTLAFYLDDESSPERRMNLSLETATISVDSHPLYQKIRAKFQSLHGEAEQKKIDQKTGAVNWVQDSSYFFLTNSQPFEFNSYQLPTSSEIAEDDSSPSVGDDFVISVTTAKIRDVFLRIAEPSHVEQVVARTTSGELLSPSLAGGPSASVGDTNNFPSGLTEICVSLPNVDVVISREAVNLFVNATISDAPSTPPTPPNCGYESCSPVLYLNSGVIRTFFNLQSSLTSDSPLDFLLACCRVSITSDVEFASRSRRQTLALDSSFTGFANTTTRSSTFLGHHNNGGHSCDNHMQVSLEQLSAYVGTWSSLSRNSSGGISTESTFGRLSPHVMNNPALQWNLKVPEPSTGSTLQVANQQTHSIFFPILATPIDVTISSSASSLEIILKQAVDLKLILNVLPPLVGWSLTLASLGSYQPPEETKPFELTILCPALNMAVSSFQSNSWNMVQQLKVVVARPQLVQRSSTDFHMKISCLNLEISDGQGKSKIFEIAKDSVNIFSPVIVLSSKPASIGLTFSEPVNIHLNSSTLVEIVYFYNTFQRTLTEIGMVIEENQAIAPAVQNEQYRLNIDTERCTLNYHHVDLTAQVSCTSLSVSNLTSNAAARSRFAVRVEKLLSFFLNGAIRYDHCILQPTDIDLVIDMRVFKVDDKVRIWDLTQSAFLVTATPVSVSITDEAVLLVNEFVRVLSGALERFSVSSQENNGTENMSSVQSKQGDVYYASRDDLRNEAVRYSFISQSLVSACDSGVIPVCFSDPGQVFIATDGLLWSYNEPRLLTKLQLSPLPFTVQGDQQVICVLQRFDDAHSRFEPIISFRVPTEKSLSLPIEQSFVPSTAFRILLKQPIAPPIKEPTSDSTSTDAVPPPATLAACCCVDSCFSSKLTPTMTAIVSVSKLEVTLAHCFPTVTSAAVNCLPYPCSAPRVRFPPLRLVMAKLTEFAFKAIDIPEKGVSCDCRFTAAVSCQNPRDLTYCDILDSAARWNMIYNKSTLAMDFELHRLNLVVNEHLLRNIYCSLNHVVSILNPETNANDQSKFPFQIPINFLCNLTSSELVISDLDTKMPAPDIKVAVQQCSPFHLHSIHLYSKEWPYPLSLADWCTSVDKKVIRVMPNESHAIVISRQTLSSKDSGTIILLTASSCLVIANCLNASFSVMLSGGGSNVIASPFSICSAPSDVKLRDDELTIEISTADGYWVSVAPTTLRLKTGTFAFVSMKGALPTGASATTDKPGHGRMFTVAVSLVVEKIESFYQAILLILPPFVLENEFPLQVNAVLTNPHRGKVVCSLNETTCPYPFCDIFQDEMVHLAPTLISQSDEEFAPQQSGPVTFSLDSISTVNERVFGQSSVQQPLPTLENAIQTVADWLKSVTAKLPYKNSIKTNVSPGADIQIASGRLFSFAPTLSIRCVPGVRIDNQTSLPLVLLSTDGSAISLSSKNNVCVPPILAGIRLGFYDSNVLWRSKPIDVMLDVDKDDVFVVEDENGDNIEADYRDNYSSDRITLVPNRSCRVGIVISSQNVECLLVVSSKIELNHFVDDRESVVLTIKSFLSAVNRSSLVNRLLCFSQAPSDNTSTAVPFYADYPLKSDSALIEVPFVALPPSTTESKYMDSIYISLASSRFLRLSFASVPFRYVTAVPSDSVFASLTVSLSPREEKNWRVKCLVIAICDNPFHDVTLRNMCDFDVYVREKPPLYDDSSNSVGILCNNQPFCISPGVSFELAFSTPTVSLVQFGVMVPNSDEIVWSEEVMLPSLLYSTSPAINSGGVNIVSFGYRSICDLQITVDSYCDTIPQIIIKNLIKALVAKQEKKNVSVQPAIRMTPLPSTRDEETLSRRSSSVSNRAQSPVGAVVQTPPLSRSRTQTFMCRFENVQVVFTDGELSAPRFIASLEGLTFGASMFATRGDGAREPTAGTFQASARRIQFDNFLEAGSKPIGFTFPVILLSTAPADSAHCFGVHGTLLSRLGETTLTSLNFSPGNFSAFIEDVNIRDFVEYILRISAIFERPEVEEANVIGIHPLPLRSLSIDACNVELTLRASLYVYIAANQTPLSLGQFKLTASSLTWAQLIHRLTTFYVRGAIFRAGLLVGSLNIIGRPLSLVRTTTYAVRDICYSPFSGRGIIRTASTAARSVLADAILSVADFAESVGRNVGQLSARSSLTSVQQPESIFDGLKQGFTALGLSIVGAIGGLAGRPMEEILAALESSEPIERNQNASGQPGSSLNSIARVSAAATRGVGLGIVGLVTQPMAGLSEFVAITGHGLLSSVGQPNMPRVADIQPFFKQVDHFDSRNILPRVEDALVSLQFSGGHVFALLRTETSNICLLLCRRTLSLFDLSERILQQTFFISDIDIVIEESKVQNETNFVKIYRRQSHSRLAGEYDDSNPADGEVDELDLNKWRVEAYLASTAGPLAGDNRSTTLSPPVYGLYSASLMEPKWRQKSRGFASSLQQGEFDSKTAPICCVTVHESHNVKLFLTIFYYLRDVRVLFPSEKS